MKVLGTGLTGLVGSRIVELLRDRYEFEFSDVDIKNKEVISKKIHNSKAPIVLHLAAKTDVDGCEKDKVLGKDGDAWKINVDGTKNIVNACSEDNKKIIYASTDFVFDGTKTEGGYTEEDIPNPINWYAQTKYAGEKLVQNTGLNWLIVRIAYPYRASFTRNDFARAILNRLKNGEKINAVTDQIFTPTFIDDIAFTLDTLIKLESTGIYHVVGSQSLSPFAASLLIAKQFNCSQSLISKTIREVYFKNRAPRPFSLSIKNGKIGKLGIKMRTLEEGLRKIKSQIYDF